MQPSWQDNTIPRVFIGQRDIERTYLLGDTHFGHTNIINFCSRPFLDKRHMDNRLFNAWVSKTRTAVATFFLGDFGKLPLRANLLPKPIFFINGNHDRGGYKALILDISGFQVLLMHDPYNAATLGWNGWLIHGHTHQNRPYVDPVAKTVNVSAEAIGYEPVSLRQIISDMGSKEVIQRR